MPRKREGNLQIKFRLSTTRRMTKSEAMRKLRRAIRSGYVPEGIEIRWIDWAKEGREGYAPSEGTIDGDRLKEMRVFYNALAVSEVRAERVAQD